MTFTQSGPISRSTVKVRPLSWLFTWSERMVKTRRWSDRPWLTSRNGNSLLAMSDRRRQDFAGVLGDDDGVLELRRQLAVARHGGPAVVEHLDLPGARVDHGLDGEA